jgi:hypothetical protein
LSAPQLSHRSSPGQPPFHEDSRDRLRFQRHAPAALWGELVVGSEVSNPTEGEQTLLDALEAHTAETNPSGAAFVLCEYNLVRREWHAAAIDKRHECPGRTVLHDR